MDGQKTETKLIHPGITDSRVLTYLNQRRKPEYVNTEEEESLLQLWHIKYTEAKGEYNKSRANAQMVQVWRDAYEGRFKVLDSQGKPTEKLMKAVRKVCFELVEDKVNSHIPAPKMSPRYHADIVPVNATEALIKHEMDRMLSEATNDEAEHSVLIDSLVWFKVGWNPFDNTHERSGNPIVTVCPIDTVFPQPGITDYKRLEYIFEETQLTVAEVIDLYGREVRSPNVNDIVPVVNCYFLNEDRLVGKFSWCETSMQVLCNDLEWGIRKRRECTVCRHISPFDTKCPVCGSTSFKYFSVKEQKLKEPLTFVTNPYATNDSDNPQDNQPKADDAQTIPENTVIPHYLLRQLPFVPYRRIGVPRSLYGMSEVEILLEDQDLINKFLNKAERKSAKSKAYLTKLKDTHITDKSDELSYVEIESPQEGQAIQVKQVVADITEEITMAQMLYDIAKSTVGVTNTDQGKADPSARSGKAKQLQMAASAQRNNAPNTLRNLAYSGVYELIFKNMLAFSDEERSYVKLLPDGSQKEEVWSKYMFLAKDDETGEFYYRDDFAWSVDTATEITQDRAAMWQLIDNDFLNGTMGTQTDPNRALQMYWTMKEQMGYPLAKYALAFLKSAQQHLPAQIEQILVQNPDAVQLALSFIQDMQSANGLAGNTGQGAAPGGAREGAGRPGNGATHAANVERTNERDRIEKGSAQTNMQAMMTGGMQGGTGKPEGGTSDDKK